MDKLTAIKIKYDDGTYSDEIPVSVFSENVEWDSTHTLVDILGSIDVDVTGTIQDQISRLFNEKVSITQLNNYVASQLNTDVANWLNNNVDPVGSAVVVDSSLTIQGAAADAKVVGNLKSAISYSPYANNEVRNGSVANPNNEHYVCMRRIMPTAGAAYILLKPIIPFAIPDGCTLSYSIAEYPESLIGEYSSYKNDQRIFIIDGGRSASADHSFIYPVATKGNSGFAYGVAIVSKGEEEETVPRDLRVSDGVVLAYDLIPAEATVNSVVYLSNNGKWHVSSVNSDSVPTVHFDDAINIIPERGRYISTFNYNTALAMLGQDYVTKGDGNSFYIAFGKSDNALVYDRKNRSLALINRSFANEDINMLLLLRAHFGGVDGGALNVPSEMKIYPSVKNDVVNEIKNKIGGVTTIANGSIGNPQNAYSIRQQVVLDTHGASQISFWLIGEVPDGYHVQACIAQYPESDIGLNIDGINDHRTGVFFEYRNVSSPDGRVCTIELNPKYHGVSFSMCVTSDADDQVHYPVSIATHSMNYKLEYLPAKFFVYVGDNNSCDIVSISNGIIHVHCHNFLIVNQHNFINIDKTNALSMLGNDNVIPDETGNGFTLIASDQEILYYDHAEGTIKLEDRYKALANTNAFNLLEFQYGGIAGGALFNAYMKGRISAVETENSPSSKRDAANNELTALSTYANKVASAGTSIDTFLFFTDPHIFYSTTVVDADRITKSLNEIEYIFNKCAADIVISGGDWLNNNNTKESAATILADIDGEMQGRFGDKYISVIGNHDTNYQGVDEEGTAAAGRLTQQALINLWYRKHGRMYYTFTMNHTRYYVFDTEIDWDNSMSEYRWEQVKWFANQLIQNDDAHSVIVTHIFSNQTQENLIANPSPMALPNYLCDVANAYNYRHASAEYDEQTYDFSAKTGKVAFYLCGHSHFDAEITYKGIPIVITRNAYPPVFDSSASDKVAFDLGVIDYDSSKLYMTRVGIGNDREINILT